MSSSIRPGRRVPASHTASLLLVATASLLLAAAASAGAAVIAVPDDHPTIQAAIDAAAYANHDTILVAPGTYTENINFNGKWLVVTSHFLLDHDPAFILSTIIDGSSPSHPDSASVVRITSTEDSLTTLQGFTLTGGTGTVWADPHGAGVYREGGGILTEGTSPIIQYNLIIANDALTVGPGQVSAGGGGIRSGDGSPKILNNIIMNNRGRYGAGIVLNYAGGHIRNNIIAENSGGQDFAGGGLWKYGYGPDCLVENNTIVNNSSALPGGGVYSETSVMTFRNNLVWGNTAPTSPQIRNLGILTISHCNVQGGFAGTGNIDAPPLIGGDYFYLRAGSPCIDAGDPDVAAYDSEDPANPGTARWPSLGTLRNDIGAYGGPRAWSISSVAVLTDTTLGWAPLEANLSAYTTLPAQGWQWDFGDGSTASGSSVSHTYEIGGRYDVTATLDTGNGLVIVQEPMLITVLADSLIALPAGGPRDTVVELVITARNTLPLDELVIPFRWFGSLGATFLGYTTNDCRTDYFTVKTYLHVDGLNHRYTLRLKPSLYGTVPPLPPGSGPVLKLRFSIPLFAADRTEDTISLAGYLSYLPRFTGEDQVYTPLSVDGGVNLQCCEHRGNTDRSPDGSVNVSDLTFLVNYLFVGSAFLSCPSEGDLSDDGDVNVVDLTSLVSFLFQGGPPPTPCP